MVNVLEEAWEVASQGVQRGGGRHCRIDGVVSVGINLGNQHYVFSRTILDWRFVPLGIL